MATLTINGKKRDVEVEADTPLLWVIREQAGLTGTKYGCVVAPSVMNAIHAATGKPVRSLPLKNVKLA